MVKTIAGGTIIEDVYIVNKPGGHFRPGEPAKVIDVVWLAPKGNERRMCFHVLYDDGVEDYMVMDFTQFEVLSETEVREGR